MRRLPSPYAASKYYAELKLLEAAQRGLEVVILRQATVGGYSPRMRFDLVVNTFVKDALVKGKLLLHGGGWMWRPLVDIDDLCEVYICCIEAAPERVAGQIRLLGPVYGQAIGELYSHAYVYVQPSLVEGTSLSLVEAMGYGNCVLVSDIPENLETVGDAGLSFDSRRGPEALRERLSYLIERPEVVHKFRQRALHYAWERYSWDRVTDAYEHLYNRLLNGERPGVKPMPM